MADALLTNAQMFAADAAAAASGVPGVVLMDNAGRAVADAICLRWGARPTAVLCGPGNNGGDGFVVARILAERGWPVSLHLLGPQARLTGDAAHHAGLWPGETQPMEATSANGAELVVDALFGAGLTRAVDGLAAAALDGISERAGVVAVDVPSGIDGDDGRLMGPVRRADLTVTFFRAKPAHYLMPANAMIGELVIADIGIPPAVLDRIGPTVWRNGPGVWKGATPVLDAGGHKFDRGHLAVIGGSAMTGAARLAARGALHAGAGVVTVLCPKGSGAIYRNDMAGIIVHEIDGWPGVGAWFADKRLNAVVVGPGLGRDRAARQMVEAVLAQGAKTVIDADGLSCFADAPQELAGAITSDCVVTPHAGEFARLFGESGDGRLKKARDAAEQLGAVVVLKGPDTVIAAPNGRAAINSGAPPNLAVAGSGDVLSGVIGAAVAMGMPTFEGAALAVGAHSQAGLWMSRMSGDALADAVVPVWTKGCGADRYKATLSLA